MSKKEMSARSSQDLPAEFSLISNKTLLALHRSLLLCRARTRPRKQRPSHNAAEYNAVAVAVTHDLVGNDYVRSTARIELINFLRGKSSAASRKAHRAGPSFPAMLHSALGAALANKAGKTRNATVVFAANGDGEAWRNALEAARAHSLPIIFVSTIDLAKEERNHAQRNPKLAPGTELPQITVDGHDVVAIYRVAHEAIERARRDRGPTLIECAEYRLRARKHNDPVANMEAYLKAKNLLPSTSNAPPRSRSGKRSTAGL